MVKQFPKTAILLTCLLAVNPAFARSRRTTLALIVGSALVTVAGLYYFYKPSQKTAPLQTRSVSSDEIKHYIRLHHPAIQVLSIITTKEIELKVIHPYNCVINGDALAENLKKGLDFVGTIRIIQEVNDSCTSHELNAIRHYLEGTYPTYSCTGLTKDYQGITVSLIHPYNHPIDCAALEKWMRIVLGMPDSISLTVIQEDASPTKV